VKQLDGTDTGSIDAGLVGDQADTLTVELPESIPFENVNARQHGAIDRPGRGTRDFVIRHGSDTGTGYEHGGRNDHDPEQIHFTDKHHARSY
jgi:hypothetical protein